MADQMTYREHLNRVVKLGAPLVGANLAGFAIHMTDTLMLGWYSVTALAASTIAGSLWFVFFMIGTGFARAVTPIVAEAVEQGDDLTARRVTRMSIWLCAGFSLLVLPPYLWGEEVLLAIGQDPDVAFEGGIYLGIVAFGFLPALMGQIMRSYLGALELTTVQMWVTIAALVMNALFNYALIFGNLGFPEMGIAGAAYASILTQTVQMIALMIYAHRNRPDLGLFNRLWKPDPDALSRVFRLGLPIGITSFAEGGLFTGSTVMMGWLGEVPLAAHGIALQLTALMFMVHLALSEAAAIRAAGQFGRRDEAALRKGAKAAISMSMTFGVIVVIIFLVFPAPLVAAFMDPDEVQRDAVLRLGIVLLMLSALFQFVDALQVMVLGLLRGVQDTRVPMWLACVSYWVVGIPISYVMAFELGWGPQGLWLGLTVGLGVAAVLLSVRFWGRSVQLTAMSAA
ncbi:MAG: MATE family efflux transporter [Pseudomonadota bacterium]